MATIPAVCNNCGAIFGANNLVGGNGIVEFSNCNTRCPFCGNTAQIIDGTYKLVEDVVKIMRTSKRSNKELSQFAETLKKATKEKQSHEQISEVIKEKVPELSSVYDAFPKTRIELYAFITLLVTILSFFINVHHLNERPKTEVIQVINYIYSNNIEEKIPTSNVVPQSVSFKKIGRNSLCPCGSGKKYKKCCIDKYPSF